MFGMVRYSIPAKSLWQLHVAMQSRLSHQPFAAAVAHFGALAPTPFRDSRYTFPTSGLGTVLSRREFHRFHAIHFQALSRDLEGTIVCSREAARGDVPAIGRDRQTGGRVDVREQRAGGFRAGVAVDHDGLDAGTAH